MGSLATLLGFGAVFVSSVVREVVDQFSVGTAIGVVGLCLLGFAAADLLSGLVHYGFDNFGSPDTPIIGQKFVKPFRDHHEDPMAMTQGDFVAVNADNFFVCLPVMIPASLLLDEQQHLFVGVFLAGLVVAVVFTNQLHKWAHMPQVPRMVAVLQRRNVILSKAHHARHHTAPFCSHYCITWGMLDPVLNRLIPAARRSQRAAT